MFDRVVCDVTPYDACYTDDEVSFRQSLEDFTGDSTDLICVGAGSQMHGRVHLTLPAPN